MKKLLSVSVAAYNVEKYIAECLDSFVDEQILEECEVLIIDDGSQDNTSDIVADYVKKYPQCFKYYYKSNGGWGSTVNFAIKKAEGVFFKQLDGDDKFHTENLKCVLDRLKTIKSDVVLTPFIQFRDVSGQEIAKYGQLNIKGSIEISEIPKFTKQIEMHSFMVRTEILKYNQIEITEHCYYTDVEFLLKSLNFCKTVQYIDTVLYLYRVGVEGQSISLEGVRKHYKEHEKILLVLMNYNSDVNENIKELFYNRVHEMMEYNYRYYFCLMPTKVHKKELMNFDRAVLDKYPEYYETNDKKVNKLRKSNFRMYYIYSLIRVTRAKMGNIKRKLIK